MDHNGGIENRTAAAAATDYLRSQILTGTLRPGSPIGQNELAKALGLSRSPVRDAIGVLAAERLVLTRAHSTAVVAPLSLEDLQELYELRITIEPSLCKLALPNLSRVALLQMEEHLKAMERTDDMVSWVTINDRFHAALYGAAARPRMVEIVDRARQQTGRYTRLLIAELGTGESNEQHRRIHRAAAAGDGPAVEEAVRVHLSAAGDLILKLLYEQTRRSAGVELVAPATA